MGKTERRLYKSDSKHYNDKYGLVKVSGMTSTANDSRRERGVPI